MKDLSVHSSGVHMRALGRCVERGVGGTTLARWRPRLQRRAAGGSSMIGAPSVLVIDKLERNRSPSALLRSRERQLTRDVEHESDAASDATSQVGVALFGEGKPSSTNALAAASQCSAPPAQLSRLPARTASAARVFTAEASSPVLCRRSP